MVMVWFGRMGSAEISGWSPCEHVTRHTSRIKRHSSHVTKWHLTSDLRSLELDETVQDMTADELQR
jgi:hypothetical protein